MEEIAQNDNVSDAHFYITAALVTLLAAIVSFKLVYRKAMQRGVLGKENVCPVHPTSNIHKLSTLDKSEQVSTVNDEISRHETCTIQDGIDEEEDIGDIRDVLIKHDDIKPVTGAQTEAFLRRQEKKDGTREEAEKQLSGPQKTKQLVEEVSKMMSDEQKEEERRIQSEQLEAIFKLVQEQQDMFGINSLQDIQDQFKLYA